MARITVDVNEELLAAAQEFLGTRTKVATINAALKELHRQKKAQEFIDALDEIELDYSGAEQWWRYGGGRDFDKLVVEAREIEAAARAEAG